MSKVKEAISAVRKLVAGETVQEQLQRRKAESLKQWRKLVEEAANGKDVDSDELILVAAHLGVGLTQVSRVFSSDVAAWKEQQDYANHSAAAEAHAAEAKRDADVADAQLEAAREALAKLEQQSKAAGWASVAWAHAEAQALSHRRGNSRLWDDARGLDKAQAEASMAVPDEETDEDKALVSTASTESDAAFWDMSSGD